MVDVVVPCHNYGNYLADCVISVLTQPVQVRVLIIDDASTDCTPEIGRELASRDSRVEFRRHEHNVGHIRTYNEGLEWISGDYFILLSADDMLVEGALGPVVRAFEDNSNIVLIYGQAIKFLGVKPAVDLAGFPIRLQETKGTDFIEKVCRECCNPIASPAAAIVRTRVQRDVGGYLSSLPHSGDLEMWLRFGAHGAIGIFDHPIGYYRQHESNMSATYNAMGLVPMQQHRLMFMSFFERFGERIPGSKDLMNLALQTLGMRAFWEASRQFEEGSLTCFEDYIQFAVDTFPGLTRTSAWRRFMFKRAVGPTMWRSLMWAARCRP